MGLGAIVGLLVMVRTRVMAAKRSSKVVNLLCLMLMIIINNSTGQKCKNIRVTITFEKVISVYSSEWAYLDKK